MVKKKAPLNKETSKKEAIKGRNYCKKAIMKLFEKEPSQSYRFHEIEKELHLPKKLNYFLEESLGDLVRKQELFLDKGIYAAQRLEKKKSSKSEKKAKISKNPSSIRGKIQTHKRGFAFVSPLDLEAHPEDIFIPKHLLLQAIDGDVVDVEVNPIRSELGPEGKVVAIVERQRKHLAGIVTELLHPPKGDILGNAIVYAPILGKEQNLFLKYDHRFALRLGDRVQAIIEEGHHQEGILGQLVEIIGHIEDPSVDIKAAISEFEIRSDFGHAVLDQVKSFGHKVALKEMKGRTDLRLQNCITIDPLTARDYDDAICVEKLATGYRLWVHIADVAHYVSKNSPIDIEASLRCNSTYFPGQCVPMLPKELSCELCSLKPKVNRLAVTVDMTFDQEGILIEHAIYRSVIKSQHRFTYEDAALVLKGKKKSRHRLMLDHMLELCHLLKKQRALRGSVEFCMPDLVILTNETGTPTGVHWVEYDETHQLVEEFMVKANEVVATDLSKKGKCLPYRIHDEPNKESLRHFTSMARSLGFRLKQNPTPQDFQDLFLQAKGSSFETQLATSFIRSMKLASYSPVNVGHFGLSLEFYCHFTSPIRRYADVLVHRTLFGDDVSYEELQILCEQSSKQERASARAESHVVLLKKLRLLSDVDFRTEIFDAIITQVKNYGIVFDVSRWMMDGYLHISELGMDDYFIFQHETQSLVGRHTHYTFKVGDKIQVRLKSIDLIEMNATWEMNITEKRKKKNKKKKKFRSREK